MEQAAFHRHTTQHFHRRALLRLFPITLPLAIAAGLLIPAAAGLVVALLVAAAGFIIFVIPYKSDMVTFSEDGTLRVGSHALRPENLCECRYRIAVASGRTLRLAGFALYDARNSTGMPALFIPIHGWLSADRSRLFQALANWIDEAGLELASDDRRELAKLSTSTS